MNNQPPQTRPNSRIRPKRVLPALLVALAVFAVACGSDDDGTGDASPSTTEATNTSPTTTEATAAESTTTVAAPVFPRTIEHSLGSTEIAEEPKVIVALDMSIVDPVLRLGLDLAGYTTYQDPNGSLPSYFGDVIAAQAADAKWVGDLLEPNLELIAGLNPDVIISSKVRHEAIYDQLSAIAPTVMTESGGGGWKDSLALVAETTGTEDRAATELAEYEARAEQVGAAINAKASNPTVSVVRFTADAIRLYQPVSFSGVVLADAGLARPESQQDTENFIKVISEEELPLADADVLFYTLPEGSPAEFATQITSRGLWGSLGAVQSGNVHAVDDDTWMAGVGLFGAHIILDDLETTFEIS